MNIEKKNKTAVIVCSNAALDYIEHPYNIPIFRSVIIFGSEVYDDYTELSAETFYNRLKEDKKNFPTTAFMAIGRMVEIFEDLKRQGYTGALVITISSKLSSLIEGVKLASKEVEDFTVTTFDSKTLGYPQSYMALEASKMLEDGISVEEIIKKLEVIRDHQHIFFSVDTLEYLIKNGRLSKFSGAIAQMLKIRPLLHFNKEGAVETLEKTRTSHKARELMVDVFLEEVKGKKIIPYIIHAHNQDNVLEVKERLISLRPDFADIKDYLLTPVVGAHSGPGAVCLGYIEIID